MTPNEVDQIVSEIDNVGLDYALIHAFRWEHIKDERLQQLLKEYRSSRTAIIGLLISQGADFEYDI